MTNIDEILDKYLPVGNSLVHDAVRYALLGGGKRVRFRLATLFAQLFNVDDNNTERLAVAVEMLHTYSLIHDDLPCMDDDDFRRGKPSCHKVYGEGIAVLAGDALLNLASEVLLGGKSSPNYSLACSEVMRNAGLHGMVLGQCLDLTFHNDLQLINSLKTAAMFVASCLSVALYAKANEVVIEQVRTFAFNYGMAFQLVDDANDGERCENNSTKLHAQYVNKCLESLKMLNFDTSAFEFALELVNK